MLTAYRVTSLGAGADCSKPLLGHVIRLSPVYCPPYIVFVYFSGVYIKHINTIESIE